MSKRRLITMADPPKLQRLDPIFNPPVRCQTCGIIFERDPLTPSWRPEQRCAPCDRAHPHSRELHVPGGVEIIRDPQGRVA